MQQEVISPIRRPNLRRFLVYTLALIGVLALVTVAVAFWQTRDSPKFTINENNMIDSVMLRTYGKYSDEHKGWLYVGNGNRTYVMRIVQQAKIESEGMVGDELYFVASGTPVDGLSGTVYGVFQIRSDGKPTNASAIEVSSPFIYAEAVPINPENIHFEVLSQRNWGWVIKVKYGTDPKAGPVHVVNQIYTPRNNDIALLGAFNASYEYDPGIDCAEANRKYDEWLNRDRKPEAAEQEESNNSPDTNNEDEEPRRCSKAKWTYKTGNSSSDAFVPIMVTGKGILEGKPVAEKTIKVMFDNKSFVYLIPNELTYQLVTP
ncbi:MAG TPA: hypothetical protein VF450_05005 [Noviherbaspirillum sp.]